MFRQPARVHIRRRVQLAPGACRDPADWSARQPGLGVCLTADGSPRSAVADPYAQIIESMTKDKVKDGKTFEERYVANSPG